MNSKDICRALKKRYCQPEWSVFFEVANGTGGNIRRYADAMAFNMFPSKGLEIVGMEIKVSRGDLLSELKNPEKADEIGKYCDSWYLVVPKGLIKETDNIPIYWGILEVNDDLSIRIKKRAKPKEAVRIEKSFMMAILRRASESEGNLANEKADELAKEKIDKAIKNTENRMNRERENRSRRSITALEFCDTLKKETGEDPVEYGHVRKETMEAYKFAIKYGMFGYSGIMSKLKEMKEAIEKIDYLKEGIEI